MPKKKPAKKKAVTKKKVVKKPAKVKVVKKATKKSKKAEPVKKVKATKNEEVKPSKTTKKDVTETEAPVVAGKIEPINIVNEMENSYLDYAMSVIVSRALPDVRDGLKPVHRRILYSMWNTGLRASSKYRKSATVVGDVIGKYHPHGDQAIYDSMVRLAQDFSMRYPLVHGQGNFGSLDGDPAAAYRYTEAKLYQISEEMLVDIEKNTVDFIPNYDGSHKEPNVLPAKLPNLLLNGVLGIAVGMATNIPPHNLGELCEGVIHLIDNPKASIDDLLQIIKGPDFPVGGIVYDVNDIKQAYATGRGGIVVRARAEIIETKKGGFKIIISEIPFQVNKATLLEKIATLVQEKKLEGIRDLRDESAKGEIRIVVDLKRDAFPKKVLNRLYQMTTLQDTFHFNMLALVDGGVQPRILNLKMIIEEHIEHRKNVVRRRVEFELAKARERAHILEGLRIALAKIDQVIKTIKKSKDRDEARTNLMKKFKLSEIQANAILEMKLQQLANLERLKIEQEYKEKMKLIKELESILKSKVKISKVIKGELEEIKQKYGDERRTEIIPHGVKAFKVEDVIPDDDTVVMITHDGYIKRLPPDTFKAQARGGKGVAGLSTKEEDIVESVFRTTTHTRILFFTSRGRVFQLKAYDIPQTSRTAKGQALVNFLQLSPGEMVTRAIPVKDLGDFQYLTMVTRRGVVKKTALSDFDKVRSSGLIAIKLKEDDHLEWVRLSTGKDDFILVTANGQAIRFRETDVRPMGRTAAGVRGIKLKGEDRIVGMDTIRQESIKKLKLQVAVIMENGFGKRTLLSEYKVQGRGGSGIKTANVTAKTGKIISMRIVEDGDERDILVVSEQGQVIRTSVKSVSVTGRATQGVKVMRFKKEDDKVASVALI